MYTCIHVYRSSASCETAFALPPAASSPAPRGIHITAPSPPTTSRAREHIRMDPASSTWSDMYKYIVYTCI